MKVIEVIFYIRGEAYDSVCQYRRQMNDEVIRDQIERRGFAMLIHLNGRDMLQRIDEMPDPGTAIPYYGKTGIGFRYTFSPLEGGCRLAVENIASGLPFFCAKTLPVLMLHLPNDPVLHEYNKETGFGYRFHSGFAIQEDESTRQIILAVTPDIYPRLEAWPFYGQALSQYQFTFEPTSVGNQIQVRHVDSEEIIDLTEDVNW